MTYTEIILDLIYTWNVIFYHMTSKEISKKKNYFGKNFLNYWWIYFFMSIKYCLMTFLDDLRFINFLQSYFFLQFGIIYQSQEQILRKKSLKIFEIELINYSFFRKISLKLKNTRFTLFLFIWYIFKRLSFVAIIFKLELSLFSNFWTYTVGYTRIY